MKNPPKVRYFLRFLRNDYDSHRNHQNTPWLKRSRCFPGIATGENRVVMKSGKPAPAVKATGIYAGNSPFLNDLIRDAKKTQRETASWGIESNGHIFFILNKFSEIFLSRINSELIFKKEKKKTDSRR